MAEGQKPEIRSFLGPQAKNAVKVQIFTALITYLLLQMNQTTQCYIQVLAALPD